MTINIKFVGPVNDHSGYAENSRMFIRALYEYRQELDINLAVEPVSFEKGRTDHGYAGEVCKKLSNIKHFNEDIRVINTTPEFYSKLKGPKKNIAYTTFETNRIPNLWVQEINKCMDAVFVTTSWCKEVFTESGVKKPVFSVPPGIFPEDYSKKGPVKYKIDIPDNTFLFYSIFQWTPRKNPEGLLRSYWAEFTRNDNVCLVLKTYANDPGPEQQKIIRSRIKQLKYEFNLDHHPRILYIPGLLTKEQITDLHRICHCFVLPHRAEGHGLPHFEAMAYGNPIITTGWSGNMEFTKPEFAYLARYQLTPVAGLPWTPWYYGDMYWAEPNLEDVRKLMRQVYNNYDKAKSRALAGQKYVLNEFDWKKRIKTFVNNIKIILKNNKE